MRIDIVTIFPAFFDPLELSLLGRARTSGLIDLVVRDLRAHAHDRHRTVDDTPYGGGPGMLMLPEPWGEALDAVRAEGATATGSAVDPLLLIPSPAGAPFTHVDALRWAEEPWVTFACGRYEGLDARIAEDAARRFRVREVSMGDYVLNGGEVAAMAIIEAVVRQVPGVVGNAASLSEESHVAGLLEAPAYTKPVTWRGLEVPPVLLGGHHDHIARWRRAAALSRTARVRPDLIEALDPAEVSAADRETLAEMGWLVVHGRFQSTDPPVAD